MTLFILLGANKQKYPNKPFYSIDPLQKKDSEFNLWSKDL